MKVESTSYTVMLQVEDVDGVVSRLPVNVQASDKDNARTEATERAKEMGYKVTNCYTVELN